MPFRLFPTSPSFNDFIPGIRPGFLTINAINSVGSPPMSKNSNPFSSTNFLNVPCVARRTRCPYFMSSRPRATNGWTSPRDPTTCMAMLRGGGASASLPSGWEVYEGIWVRLCWEAICSCSIWAASFVSVSSIDISTRPSSRTSSIDAVTERGDD